MGRLTRKQRATRQWSEFLKNNEGKDIEKLPQTIKFFERNYGSLPIIIAIRLFQPIKEAWKQNSNVSYRNRLRKLTEDMLGRGFANELQRISNKRTF
jgi:hypothetical protein